VKTLSELLVQPAAPLIRGRRIVISPFGALHHLPFGVLEVREGDALAMPLVARHEVVYLPSATSVALLAYYLGRAAIDAIEQYGLYAVVGVAGLGVLLEEGLEDWAVAEVWLQAHPENNHWVDITDTVDAKLAALRAHVSQTGHMEGFEERMRGWFGANAERAGLPEGRFAEGFFVVATA
jgi:hypothetical protein